MALPRAPDHRAILVTGAPRSGTTWLARLLATARRTALAGREPMNPRSGGYALGRTLGGWTRLVAPTPRQARLLRLSYAGRNPLCFGRYGRRQWAAPLPATRVIVKDPFAMLSLGTIARHTGARVVLVYRHPAAVLTSYRRMGWTPDFDELRAAVAETDLAADAHDAPRQRNAAEEFGAFWAALHSVALADAEAAGIFVLSHAELASGGLAAARRAFELLGIEAGEQLEREFLEERARGAQVKVEKLHNFDRDPAAVAEEWRDRIGADDLRGVERTAGPMYARLESARLRLT